MSLTEIMMLFFLLMGSVLLLDVKYVPAVNHLLSFRVKTKVCLLTCERRSKCETVDWASATLWSWSRKSGEKSLSVMLRSVMFSVKEFSCLNSERMLHYFTFCCSMCKLNVTLTKNFIYSVFTNSHSTHVSYCLVSPVLWLSRLYDMYNTDFIQD